MSPAAWEALRAELAPVAAVVPRIAALATGADDPAAHVGVTLLALVMATHQADADALARLAKAAAGATRPKRHSRAEELRRLGRAMARIRSILAKAEGWTDESALVGAVGDRALVHRAVDRLVELREVEIAAGLVRLREARRHPG